MAGLQEIAVKRAFVSGLPSNISRELRALPEVEKIEISELIGRARALLSY